MPSVGSNRAPRRVGLPLLALALVCALFGPAAPASAARGDAGAPCSRMPGLRCLQVDVPLDRSGRTQGTIPLHVEVLPPRGVSRGTMFLVAGGPGQGSAQIFDLGSTSSANVWRSIFPDYTLVAYDDRGTGSSGFLRCPGLMITVGLCAETLGAQRDFYGTGDHAEDLEAVRQAVGADRVAIWGVSYGTKLAVAYALAHPDQVDRLLLDSVLPPEEPDPFEADVLRAMPATLAAFCARDSGCRASTPNFAAEVVAVANELAARPTKGPVLQPNGTTRTVRLDGLDFLSMVVGADLNPGLAAELPAVVHAARHGDARPLLRAFELSGAGSDESSSDFSTALQAATVCHDGPFPWLPDTPVDSRAALVQAAVDALPPGGLGQFGSWAAGFGDASWCMDWPSSSSGVPVASGPLPDVPVLALSGAFDMRTPTSGAAAVVSRFPQGRLLVVDGVGHSVLTSDSSGCVILAVHDWLDGDNVPERCDRTRSFVPAVPTFPSPHTARPDAGRTVQIAARTLREAEATWLMADDLGAQLPGLYGGKLVASGKGRFTLSRYSIAPGVTLTGDVKTGTAALPPLTFSGTVTVGGPAAAHGVLELANGKLNGTLGGRTVRG
jgi:pimeloyl-ACP methyl ester carboxylesterase